MSKDFQLMIDEKIEKIAARIKEVYHLERNDLTTTIHIKMERKLTKCPCCGELTDTIHDYRTQLVKDTPAFGNRQKGLLARQ